MSNVEAQFHEAMLNIYREAWQQCKYKATAFLHMVIMTGGLSTAKRLLAGNDLQSGLYELFNCERLDLTVEALVLQPEYKDLFAPEELAEAKRRIEALHASDV